MQILTHRGLDPTHPGHPPESSRASFQSHLERGFSLEFDVQFAAHTPYISHHPTDPKSACSLDELLNLITEFPQNNHALHFKGPLQTDSNIATLRKALNNQPQAASKLFLMDILPQSALKLEDFSLAGSTAHPYDIERFNDAVWGTLLSVEEIIAHKSLYDWAWLDEWDRSGPNNTTKSLYTPETFQALRSAGIKTALVTPELHATSPGLLGGESHPDGQTSEKLYQYIEKIIQLQPNAICTDHPEQTRELIQQSH